MQAVGILGAGATLVQATSPKRGGAAPSGTDVVHHVQLVLNHVRVRPNLLIRITGQLGGSVACEEAGWVTDFITARRPTGLMAIRTVQLLEQFLATQYGFIIYIACGRHGQTTVPYHEVNVILVGHFYVQFLRGQVVIDVLLLVVRTVGVLDVPIGMALVRVGLLDVGTEAGLHFGVFR